MMASFFRSIAWGGVLLVGLVACKESGDDGAGGAGGGGDDPSSSTSTTSGGGEGGGTGGATSSTSGEGGGGGEVPGVGGGGGEGQGGSGSGGAPAEGWSIFTHSCNGASRTDALLVEDDGTLWVGCGTNQVGYGLHTSSDGGATWDEVTTAPSGEMTQFRVSAIARGDDGLLYVAGFDANDSDMVLSLDTAGDLPFDVSEVLVGGNQTGTKFHVGGMAVLSDGRIFVESLTGYGALYRPDADTGTSGLVWEDRYYWANGGNPPGYQMMDMSVSGGEVYGSGSRISEPPYVFLPPRDAEAAPWELEVVELPNTGWTGEMWGVAADEGKVVVVGVDQIGDVGKIYVSGADPYDAEGYTMHDLPDIIGGSGATWARGACIRGDRIVVVGERQPLSSGTGLVLLSDDGGATFTNITPEDDVTESVSKCHITPDGDVVVAGGGGFLGFYR